MAIYTKTITRLLLLTQIYKHLKAYTLKKTYKQKIITEQHLFRTNIYTYIHTYFHTISSQPLINITQPTSFYIYYFCLLNLIITSNCSEPYLCLFAFILFIIPYFHHLKTCVFITTQYFYTINKHIYIHTCLHINLLSLLLNITQLCSMYVQNYCFPTWFIALNGTLLGSYLYATVFFILMCCQCLKLYSYKRLHNKIIKTTQHLYTINRCTYIHTYLHTILIYSLINIIQLNLIIIYYFFCLGSIVIFNCTQLCYCLLTIVTELLAETLILNITKIYILFMTNVINKHNHSFYFYPHIVLHILYFTGILGVAIVNITTGYNFFLRFISHDLGMYVSTCIELRLLHKFNLSLYILNRSANCKLGTLRYKLITFMYRVKILNNIFFTLDIYIEQLQINLHLYTKNIMHRPGLFKINIKIVKQKVNNMLHTHLINPVKTHLNG